MAPSTERLMTSPASIAYMRKLDAIEWLAMDVLSRIERTLQENPAVVVDRQSTMLSREVEDTQLYFLQKIAHARTILSELKGLVQTKSDVRDLREQISIELMVLFVLIESYRPDRLLESGWNPGQGIQETLRERIELLGLDIINMRERLK
jgi:hypothetical protein